MIWLVNFLVLLDILISITNDGLEELTIGFEAEVILTNSENVLTQINSLYLLEDTQWCQL